MQACPAAPQGPQDCKSSTLNFHILPLVWLFSLTNSNMALKLELGCDAGAKEAWPVMHVGAAK